MKSMPRVAYRRVIDLVNAIRMSGGISNEVRYQRGRHQYDNLVAHIESEYSATHRMAMDAAKYFLR